MVLSAARRGDEWAWDRLLRGLAAPLLGYLRLRGAADPDDLANEVLFRAARGIRNFDGDQDRFRSWVFTIAHHLLVDDRRRRGRRLQLVPLDDAGMVEPAFEPAWLDDGVRDLLAQLTPDQRDVVLLRILAGFSTAEVARIVGREPNAVKQLQHRGVVALRRILAGEGDREPAADGEGAR
jgi:RNA polymerase sigma factor (sigma-70 family)